jgi:hypothetical protein
MMKLFLPLPLLLPEQKQELTRLPRTVRLNFRVRRVHRTLRLPQATNLQLRKSRRRARRPISHCPSINQPRLLADLVPNPILGPDQSQSQSPSRGQGPDQPTHPQTNTSRPHPLTTPANHHKHSVTQRPLPNRVRRDPMAMAIPTPIPIFERRLGSNSSGQVKAPCLRLRLGRSQRDLRARVRVLRDRWGGGMAVVVIAALLPLHHCLHFRLPMRVLLRRNCLRTECRIPTRLIDVRLRWVLGEQTGMAAEQRLHSHSISANHFVHIIQIEYKPNRYSLDVRASQKGYILQPRARARRLVLVLLLLGHIHVPARDSAQDQAKVNTEEGARAPIGMHSRLLRTLGAGLLWCRRRFCGCLWVAVARREKLMLLGPEVPLLSPVASRIVLHVPTTCPLCLI